MTTKCLACGHDDPHDYPGGVITSCGLCECVETFCQHGDCICTNKDRTIAELRKRVDELEWQIVEEGEMRD